MKRPERIWKFTAPLERMSGKGGWSYVEFPHEVPELFGTRGDVRVKCRFNGVVADRALMPTKSGVHILVLGAELRKRAGIQRVGDPVRVELRLDPEPDKVVLPVELAGTLELIPELDAAWRKLTPGMQRSMCHWIDGARTAGTRTKRILELLRRHESGEAPFKRKKVGQP
ncbi:MAG: YdeI/OmpD-associated family protein [Flavobacteriales bacterium]|nr:DUF1905 domain-containing protein [Flavobacteriales bacterium]